MSQNVTLGGSCSSSLSSSSAVAVAAVYDEEEEDEEDEERRNSEPLAAVSYWTLTGGGSSVWFLFIISQRETIRKIFLNLNQVTHLISVTWLNDHLNILYLFEYFDHTMIITFDDIRWLSYSKKKISVFLKMKNAFRLIYLCSLINSQTNLSIKGTVPVFIGTFCTSLWWPEGTSAECLKALTLVKRRVTRESKHQVAVEYPQV